MGLLYYTNFNNFRFSFLVEIQLKSILIQCNITIVNIVQHEIGVLHV